MESIRKFSTGATRDTDNGKNDYEGFNNPLVEKAFGDYMNEHRIQSDGSLRDSDNWQKGMGKNAMIKSLHRHYMDLWAIHRGYYVFKERIDNKEITHYFVTLPDMIPDTYKRVSIKDCCGGIAFNNNGYWFESILEEEQNDRRRISKTTQGE